jgi:hypothetical protein
MPLDAYSKTHGKVSMVASPKYGVWRKHGFVAKPIFPTRLKPFAKYGWMLQVLH